MSDFERELGRIESRLDRLESLRQRALDFLPSSAVILLLAGQWVFLWSTFAGIDQRLDNLEVRMTLVETRLSGIENRLGRIETMLGRIETKLGTQP